MDIKKLFFLILVSFFQNQIFCNDVLINSIKESLGKNPEVQKTINDYCSLKIYKK